MRLRSEAVAEARAADLKAKEYVRDANDRFFTPPALAAAFAREAVEQFGSGVVPHFVEPSYGSGNLIYALGEALEAEFPTTARVDLLTAVDVIPSPIEAKGTFRRNDFRVIADCDWLDVRLEKPADLILSNPPFAKLVSTKKGTLTSKAIIQQHVEKMLNSLAPDGLCGVLCAQRFLGEPRAHWLKNVARPFLIQQICPRPGFTDNGKSDMSEYVFCWWENIDGSCNAKETKFDWLWWDKPSRRRPKKGASSVTDGT